MRANIDICLIHSSSGLPRAVDDCVCVHTLLSYNPPQVQLVFLFPRTGICFRSPSCSSSKTSHSLQCCCYHSSSTSTSTANSLAPYCSISSNFSTTSSYVSQHGKVWSAPPQSIFPYLPCLKPAGMVPTTTLLSRPFHCIPSAPNAGGWCKWCKGIPHHLAGQSGKWELGSKHWVCCLTVHMQCSSCLSSCKSFDLKCLYNDAKCQQCVTLNHYQYPRNWHREHK